MAADGSFLPKDGTTQGELVLRAPWLTQAYFREPEKSQELWAGGWLHTGDVATISPAGTIEIRDRIKDVIKTGGESVHAAAVERALLAHPRVREVAVVGVPDGALGERVVAAVVLEAGAADRGAVWEALPQLMRDAHLPQYARPRGLVVRDALPRNSMGKVVKHRLQRQLGVHGDVGIL